MTEREIFIAALQETSEADRAAFLRVACGNDAAMRQRVEELLGQEQQLGSFLESPSPMAEVSENAQTQQQARSEHIGERIGPYKLLQIIGEGGMGVVYLAEQMQPVVRRVALKIIKPGMDTRQVIARFEAERQALAMMDHPSIAKVLDAGATDSGRPYFVMELVKGVPITRYCDQQHLAPAQRLKLFIPVCQAVQHAHQKGIIHRDLKPSNVLIALYDGQPVPKVIDFGVAKATSQRLTEKTMFTEVGSIIGTLEYMAPEQAELNNLDIDTRADIYSLGVILYELLTGSPPFSGQQLRSAAFNEMLRIIREDEPPRPSTRLSNSNELASISANRQLEPQRLTRLMRGDLDWIVMKCLEKQRERRYDTSNGLSLDLERFLRDEPVLAGPPSSSYRMRKFLRRNQRAVLIAATLLLLLVAGVAVSTWQAVRAIHAEKLALANESKAKDEAQQKDVALQAAVKSEAKALAAAEAERQAKQAALDSATEERKAKEAAQEAAESERKAKEAEAAQRKQAEAVASLLESVFSNLRPGQNAEEFKRNLVHEIGALAQSLDRDQESEPVIRARLRQSLGDTHYLLGEQERARDLFEKAWQERKHALGPDHKDTLSSLHSFIGMCHMTGQYEKALSLSNEYCDLQLQKNGPNHPDNIAARLVLAWSLLYAGRPKDCFEICQDVLAKTDAVIGPNSDVAVQALNLMAMALSALKDFSGAAGCLEQAVERSGHLGVKNPHSLSMLALAYSNLGKYEEAAAIWEKTGDFSALHMLGRSYTEQGKKALAIETHKRAVELGERAQGKWSPWVVLAKIVLANAYQANGQSEEATAVHESTVAAATADFGEQSQQTLFAKSSLATIYQTQGKTAEALKLRQEVLTAYEARGEGNSANGLSARLSLADSYQSRGEFAGAEKLLDSQLLLAKDVGQKEFIYTRRHALLRLVQLLESTNASDRAQLAVTRYLKLSHEESDADPAKLAEVVAACANLFIYSKTATYGERLARESLAIWSAKARDDPRQSFAEGVLGICLSVQGKDSEAEPLLLSGYAKAAEAPIADWERGNLRSRLCVELVQLYTRKKEPEEAQRWSEELKKLQPASSPARANDSPEKPPVASDK